MRERSGRHKKQLNPLIWLINGCSATAANNMGVGSFILSYYQLTSRGMRVDIKTIAGGNINIKRGAHHTLTNT